MNTRRKITAILFILSLAIPFTSQIMLQAKISVIRSLMKEKLEKEPLLTVTLPAHEIHWVEKGREISIDNCLFDVKNIDIKNGQAIITGLFDDEEKEIEEELAHENDERQPLNNLLEDLSTGSYYNSFFEQPAIAAIKNIAATNGPISIKKHSPPFTAVAAPPPWRG